MTLYGCTFQTTGVTIERRRNRKEMMYVSGSFASHPVQAQRTLDLRLPLSQNPRVETALWILVQTNAN